MDNVPETTIASPLRQAISVAGNRCVILAAPDIRERAGSELASSVGKPRLAALLVEEGVSATRAEEVRRLITSSGFRTFDVALPSGWEALSLSAALDVADELAGRGLTPDDGIVAIGGMEALSLASWVAGNWGSKAACVGLPTTLEALILASCTPHSLSAGATKGIIHCPPAFSALLADPVLIAEGGDERTLENACALMVQSAFVESPKAFDLVVTSSETLSPGDTMGLISQAIETARARGRLASSTLAGARRSLDIGLPLARALAACLGEAHSFGVYLAEGLRFEARLAWQLSGLDPDVVFALDALLARFGLGEVSCSLTPDELSRALKEETAKLTNRRMFVLPRAVGRALPEPVDDEILAQNLAAFCQARRPKPEPVLGAPKDVENPENA